MALGDGVKRVEGNEIDSAKVQRRGLHYKADLPEGHVLSEDDLVPLRPMVDDGFPPYELEALLGKPWPAL